MKKKIEELLELDIIETVVESIRWTSPLVSVLKDNADIRLCVEQTLKNAIISMKNQISNVKSLGFI